MPNDEVIAFSQILGNLEIEKDKDTFKGNAIKKHKRFMMNFKKLVIKM